MRYATIVPMSGLAVAASASAAFTGMVVTSVDVTNSGQALRVFTVAARFDGPTDTVLNIFNFGAAGGSSLTGFWHKDNASYNSGSLSQTYGTWSASQTGSGTLNRPFDSYLTIGGIASGTNTTNADPSWVQGGNTDSRSWNRPDIPNPGTLGWFNSNPPNLQGRVGNSLGLAATDVRLGQFVLSQSDANLRTYGLTIGYNNGVAGAPVQFATTTFSLVPVPGAIAMMTIAGLRPRRRR